MIKIKLAQIECFVTACDDLMDEDSFAMYNNRCSGKETDYYTL